LSEQAQRLYQRCIYACVLESLCALVTHFAPRQNFYSVALATTLGDVLENLFCLRCNRELEPGQKSVAVYVFAQTVGIRPRQKSAARRICFCSQCSVSLAMGPPPDGALNVAAWQMIRELVSSDPALTAAAWEDLRGLEALLPANVGGYLEF
jgi:hypothetical protein